MKPLPVLVALLALGGCSTGAGDRVPPAASDPRALPEAPPPPALPDEPGVCPADVKQCADGSFVSRIPARDCAFAACPGATR